MSETLSFPGLGLELELGRVAFTVFGRPIYWYGVIFALAFLVGAFYVMRRCKIFGLDPDRVMDVVLGGVLLGIVGARLYYVLFSGDTYDLLSVLNVRKGGLAIYGGVIGALIGVILVCRWRRVKLAPTLDLGVGGIIVGQAIGRWGNFVNIEAFGSNTAAKWGMISPTTTWYLQQHKAALAAIGVTVDPDMPVHPTFLYESIWCLLGFLVIAWYTNRRRFDGELALIYLGWYGLGRFFIEGLRTDSLMLGSIRVSQVLALLCVIASVVVLVMLHSRIRRANDPDFMPLYVNTDEGRSVLAGTFYKKPVDEKADTSPKADDAAEETAGAAGDPESETDAAGDDTDGE